MTRELALERLLGRRVHDADGASLGCVEDVVAEHEGDALVVRAWLVGTHALAERLGGGRLAHAVARLLTRDRGYERFVVPWDAMDLRDPDHPRATRPRAELARLAEALERGAGGVPTGRLT